MPGGGRGGGGGSHSGGGFGGGGHGGGFGGGGQAYHAEYHGMGNIGDRDIISDGGDFHGIRRPLDYGSRLNLYYGGDFVGNYCPYYNGLLWSWITGTCAPTIVL